MTDTTNTTRRDYIHNAITNDTEMSLLLIAAVNAAMADPADQQWLIDLLLAKFDGPAGAERWLLDFSTRARAHADQKQREADDFAATANRLTAVMERRGAETIGDLFAQDTN